MNVVSEKSGIFAADMEEKHLYIIAGPNDAGKTINNEVEFKTIAAYVKH
jgi:hypothetical protein